jgi:DNA-binding HxlR family transcriptional regulator
VSSLTAKKISVPKRVVDYRQKTDYLRDGCAGRAAIDVVRGRWKPSILFHLKGEPKRFTELQEALAGITAQALTVQLRQLEADEIVHRMVYPEIPLRVEYSLSDLGRSLSDVMAQFEEWGAVYLRRQAARNAKRGVRL